MIGGDSLSRFFTLHVFVIPGALLAALGVHLWLVLKLRNQRAAPRPGELVDPQTYDAEYTKELHKAGVPFLGDAAAQGHRRLGGRSDRGRGDCGRRLGPKGPSGPPDPTLPRRESTARLAVPLVVRPALAQPAGDRDVRDARLSR